MSVSVSVDDPRGLVARVSVLVESDDAVILEVETSEPVELVSIGRDEVAFEASSRWDDQADDFPRVRIAGLPPSLADALVAWGSWMACVNVVTYTRSREGRDVYMRSGL